MNTMNIKEMTKEEASAFLKNKKILCKNEKESLEVQNKFLELRKKLLNLDCIWRSTTKMYYLFFLDNISVFTPIDNYNVWIEDPREELKVQDLLDIQIKDDSRFDPKTLQPFDKVLVRDCKDHNWRCNLFSCILEDESLPYQCVTQCWNYCIPYNEVTKHLLNTNKEAPEYYQVWKN